MEPNANQSGQFVTNRFVTGNRTTELDFQWSALAIFSAFTSVVAPCANLVPFVAILVRRLWKNPFYVYVLNLLLVNAVQHLGVGPLDTVTTGYHVWIFGYKACTFYLYMLHTLGVGHFHCHLLITFNRIWATAWPVSYRNRHTVKVAVFICLTMWFLEHCLQLPGPVLDALYYRTPVSLRGCFLNLEQLKTWNLICVMCAFSIYVTNVVTCAVILVRRRRKKVIVLAATFATQGSMAASKAVDDQDLHVVARDKVQNKRNNQAYRVFIIMTTSINITWAPVLFYLMFAPFLHIHAEALHVIVLIYQLQGIIFDPILFVASMKDLREAIFCRRSFRWIMKHAVSFPKTADVEM